MAAQLGRELLLKIHDGSSSYEDSNYVAVGGFNSNDIKITNSEVDITSKDSGGFKESLDGGGQRSFSSTAAGTFLSDAAFQTVHDHMMNATHPLCRVIVPGHGTYEGKFAITNLELMGREADEVNYSISFSSSGVITFTPEVA
ncbi:phage major tail protein, TP901-1 family [Kordiimonas aestuarii]|uniref:phage major tail protein, TP901-1 family n=1 Tax=Kordiimonas aestuarii TaxID=1005925 RepID=UPI0021D2B27D|nr:phage major tail protein, TP901-1 family [Kordiimonas aestuarii]